MSLTLRSGLAENVPYSLSRWTDVPISKWGWMSQQVKQGWMVAFDQRTSLPDKWSLKPEDTLGLIFWTKNPKRLLETPWVSDYRVKVHVTITGWHEVERGAPDIDMAGRMLKATARKFGPENVTWRFSPVPVVSDTVERFKRIAGYAQGAGIHQVFLSFLQNNDLMPETRSLDERLQLMQDLAVVGEAHNIKVLLCNEDRTLADRIGSPNLSSGICAPPEDFGLPGRPVTPSEGCGCGYAVEPFTINESCQLGCSYCYAADQGTASKKRNTTRLPIIQ